jgi:hypothetical protein
MRHGPRSTSSKKIYDCNILLNSEERASSPFLSKHNRKDQVELYYEHIFKGGSMPAGITRSDLTTDCGKVNAPPR